MKKKNDFNRIKTRERSQNREILFGVWSGYVMSFNQVSGSSVPSSADY